MMNFKVDKLFDFLSSEGTCECCGTSCKTALCSTCQQELIEMIDEGEASDKLEAEAISPENEKLSA